MRTDLKTIPPSDGHTVVGKVQKAHGIRGELFLLVFSGEAAWLSKLKEVSLILAKREGGYERLRLKVERKSWHKQGIIVKAAGVDDRNRAEELVGAFFEVPESFFVSAEGEDIYLREILNFHIENQAGENVGQILGFWHNGAQDLAVVETARGEFDIPLVDDWIVELNKPEKKIKMSLPYGLLGEDLGDGAANGARDGQ